MLKILLKKNKNKLLDDINRVSYFNLISDLSDSNNFLQLASLKFPKERNFKPHMHIWRDANHKKIIGQESWIVIQGFVKVFSYDLDKKLLSKEFCTKVIAV
jgi:hypothetical protein